MIHRILWVGLLLLFLVTPTYLYPKFVPFALSVRSSPSEPLVHTVVAKEADKRILYLSDYLENKGSPMSNSAVDFIEAADQYNLDWTLLPSITGLESSYGKYIPAYSHNPFGWGHNNGNYSSFRGWREAIFTVASGLRKSYIPTGPIYPGVIGKTYAESPTWAVRVEAIQGNIQNDYKRLTYK